MTVKYNEDGSIEIDNGELLNDRADVENATAPLGGINEESELKRDKIRNHWSEPTHKPTDLLHICPICNVRFYGRPNKVYCMTSCKEIGKKRRQRQRKRDLRNFKPYRGKTGEVYFMCSDEKIISFVPAFNAESREKAKKYLDETHPTDKIDNDYYQQVKEVIRK